MKNWLLLFGSLLLLSACDGLSSNELPGKSEVAEPLQPAKKNDDGSDTVNYPGMEEYTNFPFYMRLTEELQKLGEPGFNDTLYLEEDDRLLLLSLSADMGSTVAIYDYQIGENNLIEIEAEEITYISHLEFGELIDQVVGIEGKSCRNSIHMVGDLEILGEEKFLDEVICLDVAYKYDIGSRRILKEREDRFRPGSLDEFYSFFER